MVVEAVPIKAAEAVTVIRQINKKVSSKDDASKFNRAEFMVLFGGDFY